MYNIRNITFNYRKRHNEVFSHFTVDLHLGKIYGLLGKNGAGKSTLLSMMAGLIHPQSGEIRLNGTDIHLREPDTLNKFFLVPEEFMLPAIKLQDYVKRLSPFYPKFSDESLRRNLDAFNLTDDLHLGELSMGQKKKVFISFALAANTEWLLLDEPTNGLDIPGKSQFRKIIVSEMSDERSVVISTHQVQDVNQLLDELLVIDNGKVLLQASVSNICSKMRFVFTDDPELLHQAFYVMPTFQGNCALLKNSGDSESQLYIELLFQALMEKGAEINALLTETGE